MLAIRMTGCFRKSPSFPFVAFPSSILSIFGMFGVNLNTNCTGFIVGAAHIYLASCTPHRGSPRFDFFFLGTNLAQRFFTL